MIESILTKLNSIPADKVMHFAIGTVLYAAFLPFIGAWWALLPVTVFAVGKEIYDYQHKATHTPDVWDAVVTIAGGGVGFFCTYF